MEKKLRQSAVRMMMVAGGLAAATPALSAGDVGASCGGKRQPGARGIIVCNGRDRNAARGAIVCNGKPQTQGRGIIVCNGKPQNTLLRRDTAPNLNAEKSEK